MNNKTIIIEFGLRIIMKNYGDRGGCYPPRPTASMDDTFLDLHNSFEDTQNHSLIVNYLRRHIVLFQIQLKCKSYIQ